MSHQPELSQWVDPVSSHFPQLSKALATGLALWSFGMIVARSCSLTAVAGLLAPLRGQSFNPVRERLRDPYREAAAKAGTGRTDLVVADCWAPWLAWVLEGWSGRQLAIAIDASTLGQRFVVLALSVVSKYRTKLSKPKRIPEVFARDSRRCCGGSQVRGGRGTLRGRWSVFLRGWDCVHHGAVHPFDKSRRRPERAGQSAWTGA